MLKSKLLSATAAAPEVIAIEDVFSTYLYTGTNTTNPIANGIDLANEGGMVWLKWRGGSGGSGVYDTERGVRNYLETYSTSAQSTAGVGAGLTTFNSDGFTLGTSWNTENSTNYPYVSWTFRKAPRFFDVVTYTGTGSAQTSIPHNLNADIGMILIKRTNTTSNWFVWHRGNGSSDYTSFELNSTVSSGQINPNYYNKFTSTTFSPTYVYDSGFANANVNGSSYVAYLFAHDPLGPSGDGSDGLIACGSYTGNSGNTEIDLGWEPQWVMIKRTNSAEDWLILDVMRGWVNSGDDVPSSGQKDLLANTSAAEATPAYAGVTPQPNGFKVRSGLDPLYSANGSTYIYIAIRRGPMREPTSGTEVFDVQTYTASTGTVRSRSFAADMLLGKSRTLGDSGLITDRLRGFLTSNAIASPSLFPNLTNAEINQFPDEYNVNNNSFTDGGYWNGYSLIKYAFRRAPGFFDVVAYTGDGVAGRTVSHNLGVAPELMIVKNRNLSGTSWAVYHSALNASNGLRINTDEAAFDASAVWNNTAPTSSEFSVGTISWVNSSSSQYIAYLFATLPGVSKVGSYTGNGSSQTINCGFTGGARFVLIKRTDSSGDWYVWDTARGIVSGNDPHLSLNTTAAEVTTDDTIDPDSSGFIVNQVSATNVNVSSASYIYLAIA
jgi:hypothetical protein